MHIRQIGVTLLICATSACTQIPQSSGLTSCVSIRLSEVDVSLLLPAPPAAYADVPYIDLSKNSRFLTPLVERSWREGGILGDTGALEVKLLLAKHRTAKHGSFLDTVLTDYNVELGRVFKSPKLAMPHGKQIGGAEWMCFEVEDLGVTDCVHELSRDHYLIWRRRWIANRELTPSAELKALGEQIEQSIRLSSAQ